MYVVTYKGQFGFIKPWTAVRDGETKMKRRYLSAVSYTFNNRRHREKTVS